MAARIDRNVKPITRERIATTIKTTHLMKRLQSHSDGVIEMTSTQIRAAEILLDRTVPKLQSIQHSGDAENPVALSLTVKGIPRK